MAPRTVQYVASRYRPLGFGDDKNLLSLPGMVPRTVQYVASRYRPLVTRTSSKSGEEWLQCAVHGTENSLRRQQSRTAKVESCCNDSHVKQTDVINCSASN